MDANPLNFLVLCAVGAAVFFYVLYGVVRAATLDGIIDAARQAEKAKASGDESELRG
ncbi:hypothetical protein ACFC25_19190 [Pseudarthrobacter sp. NPDC055928]|uniref:hypothetical protein n=1 Tax=Pseudarthrobacter sp. NPDC055928 TaxID=3345661 RepID=UPI0035E00EEF